MIFLNILKIIGFVLLGLIGLILIILLFVLFWPFIYKIEGSYYEKLKFKAVVHFFFHFIRAIFTFEDGNPLLVVKVLWFTVYKDDFSDEEEEGLEESDEGLADFDENILRIDSGGEEETSEEASENPEDEIAELTDEEIEEAMAEELPKKSLEDHILDFFDSIKKVFQKIKDKWYNLKRKGHEFERKVRYYQKLIKYYYRVLHHPSMKPAYDMAKKTVIGILKHIRPRKLRAYVHFGSDNPATTAKAVAAYSMIYPFYRKKFRFDADFENKVFEAKGYIKGRFQLSVLAFYAVRAYFNKHIRKMIKLFTREGKKNGRTK